MQSDDVCPHGMSTFVPALDDECWVHQDIDIMDRLAAKRGDLCHIDAKGVFIGVATFLGSESTGLTGMPYVHWFMYGDCHPITIGAHSASPVRCRWAKIKVIARVANALG